MNQPKHQHTSGTFTRLLGATGLSNLADGVAVLVWAWLATLLTRDPVLIAVLPVALRLPWLVLSIPAGLIVDRTDRRQLIMTMDAVRACAFGGAAVAVWLSLPLEPAPASGTSAPFLFSVLVVSAVIIGSAEVFRDTASQTLLPALVHETDLERANGRLYSVELVGNTLLGPALGAFLIAWLVWAPFAANVFLVLAALIILHGLKGGFAPENTMAKQWKGQLREGLQIVLKNRFLQVLAVATAVWNFFHQMVVIGLVLHVQENLGLDAPAYGLILASGALAGIAAGFVAEQIVRTTGAGRAAQWSSLSSALAFGLICFAPNGFVLVAILMFFEFGSVFWNVVSISYRQRVIPDQLLGRVNGIYRMLSWGMMSLGLLFSGLLVRLSETVMPRELALIIPFAVSGIAVFILTAVIWKDLGTGFGNAGERTRVEDA